MSDANAGLAFPANKAIVSMEVVNLSPLGMRLSHKLNGWGGWIRTNVWRDQNPLPYHLATPQHVQALQTACAELLAPAKCPGQAPAARLGGPTLAVPGWSIPARRAGARHPAQFTAAGEPATH